jgi:protein TonB
MLGGVGLGLTLVPLEVAVQDRRHRSTVAPGSPARSRRVDAAWNDKEKAIATAKRNATRAARGIAGPKAKKAVHCNVTATLVVTPAMDSAPAPTTAPTTPAPAPAPAPTPAPAPAKS